MQKLREYLKAMKPSERSAFAERCGTTAGYLQKAMSKGQLIGEGLCLRIVAEAGGTLQPADIRADLDWAYLLRQARAPHPPTPPQPSPHRAAAPMEAAHG